MFRLLSKISVDALVYGIAFALAYWIRFDGPPQDPLFLKQIQVLIGLVILLRLTTNFAWGIYRQMWAYLGLNDAIVILTATAIPSMVLVICRVVLTTDYQLWRVPYGVTFADFLLAVGGTLMIRVMRRVWFERSNHLDHVATVSKGRGELPVLLVGAGMAGIMVAKEAQRAKNLNWRLIGFVDDDRAKQSTTLYGLPVLGTTWDIPRLVKDYGVGRVIITIANATSRDIRRIVEICEAVPVRVKIIPGMFEILDDKVTINKLRDVAIDDLLRREVVSFDECAVSMGQFFHGKRILVTGAGGSIGSEICRQLGVFAPAQLLLLDKDENGIFEVDRGLASSHPHIQRKTLVCDIRNFERLSLLLKACRPHAIFHAAAHKHVPLMEENPVEAVTNNIQGTLNLLELTEEVGCEHFVMLSTDKAVNPSSIMGATKRVAELIIQSFHNESTHFSCVRFGNVLGSRGSVVPVFQDQIRKGGPITITDREVVRFFMTIPEAVQLVIQAATLGSSGEVFVLDMGKPVRIVDLARDLIRLSGLDEDTIDFQYTGLRPGEKLYEELFYPFEKPDPTSFSKIVSVAPLRTVDFKIFWDRLTAILRNCAAADSQALRRSIFELVADFSFEDSRPEHPVVRSLERPKSKVAQVE